MIQGDLNKVKEFHLEIKSNGGKCRYCSKRSKPSTRKLINYFLGQQQGFFLQVVRNREKLKQECLFEKF
jgi:hypothetical protein